MEFFGISVILLILNFSNNLCESRLQSFTIHNREDCSDKGENHTLNSRNLEKFSYLVKCGIMKCFCNQYGVWVFSMNTNYARGTMPNTSGLMLMEHPVGVTCQSIRFNTSFLQIKSIRHIGNSDVDLSGLSLFIDQDFFGKELYLKGTSVSLIAPILFKSYGITGNSDWTLYPKTNFEGNATCLRSKAKINTVKAATLVATNQQRFIVFVPNKRLVVGSIRLHCYPTKERERKFNERKSYLVLFIMSSENEKKVKAKLVIDTAELRLVTTRRFHLFATVGTESWTIYSGTEFNGRSTCLSPDGLSTSERENRRRFKRNSVSTSANGSSKERIVLIGSVKKGCASDHCMDQEEDDFVNFDAEFAMDADTNANTTINVVTVKEDVDKTGGVDKIRQNQFFGWSLKVLGMIACILM